MKNLKNKIMCISVIALLLVSALKADAQKGEFGVRFMPTFSSFDMQTSDGNTVSGSLSIGYGVGVFGGFSFSDHVAIQAEIQYLGISQKYKENDIEREINLRYVNIPLLLSFNTGKTKPVNLNAVIGPQLGISVGSDIHVSGGGPESEVTHATLSVKTSDIGFAYGVGVDFGLTESQKLRLGLGFRGVYGLLDISDKSQALTDDSFYVLERSQVKTYAGYIGFSFLF
jgi:outer membrane autotransporter protein